MQNKNIDVKDFKKKDYFIQARQWYNDTFLEPMVFRSFAFIAFFIMTLNILLSVVFLNNFFPLQEKQNIVIKTQRDPLNSISVTRLDKFSSLQESILNKLVREYVTTREELVFDSTNDAKYIFDQKLRRVKNNSTLRIFLDFQKNIYNTENENTNDIKLYVQGVKREIDIEKIYFKYDTGNSLFSRITRYIAGEVYHPSMVSVIYKENFSYGNFKDKRYIVDMKIDFSVPDNNAFNREVFFKISEYNKTEID